MKILFMGTPDFAVAALQALIDNPDTEIVGVVTQPDKPRGRGYQLMPTPVKECAMAHELPVYQPEKLRGEIFLPELQQMNPDLIVVAAYGKILPSYILTYPKFGCINIHASLLPRYRGAAPIQRAIMEGNAETGITIMQMNDGLDTGDILSQTTVSITENDNFETLHDKMAEAGAAALSAILPQIALGEVHPRKQDDTQATYAAKIEKHDCAITFDQNAEQLHCIIRALSPTPLAYAMLNGKSVKITAAILLDRDTPHDLPGKVLAFRNGLIEVACRRGSLGLIEVLPEGKKRMRATDFVNGRFLSAGDIFTSAVAEDCH